MQLLFAILANYDDFLIYGKENYLLPEQEISE